MRLKIDKSTKEVCNLKCSLCGDFVRYGYSSFRGFGALALEHLATTHGIDVKAMEAAQLNELLKSFYLNKEYRFEDIDE